MQQLRKGCSWNGENQGLENILVNGKNESVVRDEGGIKIIAGYPQNNKRDDANDKADNLEFEA